MGWRGVGADAIKDSSWFFFQENNVFYVDLKYIHIMYVVEKQALVYYKK